MGKSGRLRKGCSAIKRLESSKLESSEEKRSQHFNNLYKLTNNKGVKANVDQDKHNSCRWPFWMEMEKKPVVALLEKHIEDLDSKRATTREWALHGLVKAFEEHVLYDFVENKSFTLTVKFINSLTRESPAEALLAGRMLGLLILTDGCSRNAHEIMEYAIPYLSQALRHKSEAVVALALRTLAILTFVGSDDITETERSMILIWDIINPKLSSEGGQAKVKPTILAAGISAWSLLLSSIDGCRISSTYWKGAIHFFCNLACMYDQSIRTAAVKAIGLILDTDKLYKFSKDDSQIESSQRDDKILDQVKSLLTQHEKSEFAQVPAKLLKKFSHLKNSTRSQRFQFAFLRDYLGDAYVKHMQENKIFHDIFDHFASERKVCLPIEDKVHVLPAFNTTKERTQYRNKQRCVAKAKREGHFAFGVAVSVS